MRAVLLLMSVGSLLVRQAPAGPAFDVASIKINKTGTNQSKLDLQPGGRFTAINVSLFMLINFAYGDGGPLPPNRVSFTRGWNGGHSNLETEKFDIIAKGFSDFPQSQLQVAVRSLLAERFKLVVHHETREKPIYALVLARPDGRLGPRLTPSTIDCSTPNAVPPAADGTPRCGFRNAPGRATGRATIAALAQRLLARAVEDQRVVEDRTGLPGTYEFDLEWTPAAPATADAPSGSPVDPGAPSLFTALREQLGLRLEPQKDQVDVLVVDHAEYPSVN